MFNIDKLRDYHEKPFLDLMNGLECRPDSRHPENIWWYKNNLWYFYQNEKTGYLECHYDRVWSVLSDAYALNYEQTQAFIKHMMERHFKLGYLTPWLNFQYLCL